MTEEEIKAIGDNIEKALDFGYNKGLDHAIEVVDKIWDNINRQEGVDIYITHPYSTIIKQLQSLKK